MLGEYAPDVITLDVHMPRMDGLTCLDRIMIEHPCPVVMVSALTADAADATLEALHLGAVDFIAKPGGAISMDIHDIAPLLVDKVRAAAGARLRPSLRLKERVRHRVGKRVPRPRAPRSRQCNDSPEPDRATDALTGDGLVLIGVSTGGPPALETLLTRLPAGFPLAHPDRAAHAGELYRSAGTTSGRAVRADGYGSAADGAIESRQRLYRPRRRGPDRYQAARPAGRDGGSLQPRIPVASQRRSAGQERDGSSASQSNHWCAVDRAWDRMAPRPWRICMPMAAGRSRRRRRRQWSGACPGNLWPRNALTGLCRCLPSPTACND